MCLSRRVDRHELRTRRWHVHEQTLSEWRNMRRSLPRLLLRVSTSKFSSFSISIDILNRQYARIKISVSISFLVVLRELMANSVKLHRRDASVILACTTVAAKTLVPDWTAPVPTILRASVASTSTMLVKPELVRMVRHALTMDLVSLASARRVTPEKPARKILSTAKKTLVPLLPLASILLANSSVNVRSTWLVTIVENVSCSSLRNMSLIRIT